MKHWGCARIDPRYFSKEGGMVIMFERTLCRTSLLSVGPYRFTRYTSNLGLVVEVENKAGTK